MDKKQKNFIFPQDTYAIIEEIMQKQNIETSTDFFEKIMKGQKTNGEVIAESLAKVAKGIISLEDMAFVLQKKLKIDIKKAKAIADEIKKRVFRGSEEGFTVTEQPHAEKIKKPKDYKYKEQRDKYREPIE